MLMDGQNGHSILCGEDEKAPIWYGATKRF